MTNEPEYASAAPYPDDPEAPYFEHLYALVSKFRPGVTRDETLSMIREADPEDTLRISAAWTDLLH